MGELYTKYNAQLKELGMIENELPQTYINLIALLDKNIFIAENGFDLATKIYITAKDIVKEAMIKHESILSEKLNMYKGQGIKTGLRDYAKADCSKEKISLLRAENLESKAGLLRSIWLEKLNTYKKIKSSNVNERGNG